MIHFLKYRLVKLREKQGLSQREFVNKFNEKYEKYQIKISTSAYGYYETGDNEPSLKILVCLADLYNVSVDYLLGLTNNLDDSDAIRKALKSMNIYELLTAGLKDEGIKMLLEYREFVYSKYKKSEEQLKKEGIILEGNNPYIDLALIYETETAKIKAMQDADEQYMRELENAYRDKKIVRVKNVSEAQKLLDIGEPKGHLIFTEGEYYEWIHFNQPPTYRKIGETKHAGYEEE